MSLLDPDVLLNSVLLGAYALLAAILTAAGLFAEYASLQQYAAGEAAIAVWLAALGAVFLYAGVYVLGYQRLVRLALIARSEASRE